MRHERPAQLQGVPPPMVKCEPLLPDPLDLQNLESSVALVRNIMQVREESAQQLGELCLVDSLEEFEGFQRLSLTVPGAVSRFYGRHNVSKVSSDLSPRSPVQSVHLEPRHLMEGAQEPVDVHLFLARLLRPALHHVRAVTTVSLRQQWVAGDDVTGFQPVQGHAHVSPLVCGAERPCATCSHFELFQNCGVRDSLREA
ncbi:MAG: hypothetical protein KVP17_002371 [Porospora cf. gigantea B]|uniref:uncharacterized protein n=1 Tax=Porospora cf. gigantea B TaxID=2853592 RepID=UPI003571D38D|nr:MAG: hypothetical protein KVP17_002371 [Porospora cf. gigantea B]